MLTLSHIFSGVISSTFVSYLYGLMWHILCLIYIIPHCNVNMPFVHHCIIKNGPLYRVSYFYAVLLLRINLAPTLCHENLFLIFLLILYLLICAWFRWHVNSQSTLCYIRRIISRPNTNWPESYSFCHICCWENCKYCCIQNDWPLVIFVTIGFFNVKITH